MLDLNLIKSIFELPMFVFKYSFRIIKPLKKALHLRLKKIKIEVDKFI